MSLRLEYNDVINTLRAPLRHPTPAVRWVAWLGWALLLSGVVHVGVWALAGLPELAGPTGWRKPIVFGLSGGLATLSLASLAVSVGARSQRWLTTYLVTMAVEVGLIDLQAWRGVPSHFNDRTALDGAIFSIMGVVIITSMVAALVVGVRAARALSSKPDEALAAWLGTGALALGALVGLALSAHGSYVQATGLGVPSQLGAAGQWKPVHGIALHGLQLFPVLAWALQRRGVELSERVRALWFAAAAWGTLLAASVVQLFLGRAPLDLAAPSLVLVGAALTCALTCVGALLHAAPRRVALAP